MQSPQGVVHGGQQPIGGAAINLYEVGTSGYGSTPTLLYSTTTGTSGAGLGTFSFPIAGWSINCTASGSNSSSPVYITSSGGNAGSGANGAILLVAALGSCNNINASTFVYIDEVTTVAAAYALGQFMNPANPAQIGYLSSQTGIQNAFTTAGNLANVSTGTANALTPNGNGAIPQAEINSLADILAYCVNGSAANCTTLEGIAFNLTGSTLGTSFSTPTNTLMAAQQIAAYPGNRANTLFGLVGGTGAQFQPTLSSAPNDWTIAVQYAANGVDKTTNPRVALAVDNSDNIWIANLSESNVEMLNNQGVPAGFSPVTTNISGPTGLAIDTQGNAWVSNAGNSTVLGLCPNGGQCGNIYNNTTACNNNSPCGINQPFWLAFDGSGNLWVVNSGTPSLSELFSVGNGTNNNGDFAIYTPSSVVNPEFVALDLSGNAWVADYGSHTTGTDAVETLSAHGVSLAKETGSGLSDPEDVAIDRSGNIWVGSKADAKLTEYSSNGTVLSGSSGYGGIGIGGINDPTVVAVDGANRIWTANGGDNSISEFSNASGSVGTAISPPAGYTSSGISGTSWLAIDKSGNVWVSSSTPTAVSGTTLWGAITEFVGAAAPVVTPQMQALQSGQLAVTPGTPTPVTILTNTLPYYAKATGGFSHPYNAQLQALGGSGSYTWSTDSAGTTVLTNAGLGLSAAGAISGTPTQSGPLTINVTVADSTNGSNTASTTLTLNSADQFATSPGANDGQLSGTYTFFYESTENSANTAGAAPKSISIGTITANGNGTLTGEMDFNNKTGLDVGGVGPVAFTGYYTVNSSNVGLMSLLLSVAGQNPVNFAFSAGSLGTSPAVYQNLEIIRYDDTRVTTSGTTTNAVGSGFAKLQTATTLATGNWVFGFDGETPCTTAGGNVSCTAGATFPYGPLGEAGVFTTNGSGGVTAGEEDAAAVCPQSAGSCGAYNYNAVTLAGSYGTADGSGRGTVTLTPTGSLYPDPPTHFLYYVISPTEIVMMSSDSHATYSLLGGDVALQQGTIGNSTFANGATLLPYGLLSANGDGTSVYPTQSAAQIVVASVTNPGGSCSGAPSLTINVYQNNSGTYQYKPQGTLCTAIAGNGRLTFPSGGTDVPIGYIASGGLAFMSQQVTSPGDSPGLVRTELQTATAFTGCNMFGGTLPPPVPMTIGTGYTSASSCPTTTYTQTGYQSYSSYGLLESGTQTLTIGTPNSGGVVTGATDSAGNNSTVIVISGTRGLVIDANQGDLTPTLSILQK